MPKILIIDPCLVNFADDRGGIHHDAGDMPDVPKAAATDLVRRGRALYINKADDTDKAGRYTASADMVKAAKAIESAKAKEAAKEAAKASEPPAA